MLSGQWLWRFHLTTVRGAGLWIGVPPAVFWNAYRIMRKSELVEFHEREAERYRRLLTSATTPALKTRLAQQAEEHERLAKEVSDRLVLADA